MLRRRTLVIVVAMVAVLAMAFPVGGAFAYGARDQPLAQLTFSGNCDNLSFPLCAPPPAGVGTGGIWFWIEIDTGGTGDIAGAGCGHTIGGIGGPGGAGAGSIRGDITWTYGSASTLPPGAFVVAPDPTDTYYVVTIGPGEIFAFPVTQGHYSFHPVAGVAIEATVAP